MSLAAWLRLHLLGCGCGCVAAIAPPWLRLRGCANRAGGRRILADSNLIPKIEGVVAHHPFREPLVFIRDLFTRDCIQ
jgi:hypothetical protein